MSQFVVLPQAVDFLALHAAHPKRYPCLLESVANGTAQARFDILFATNGEYLVRERNGDISGVCAEGATGFLQALESWVARESSNKTVFNKNLPSPFIGGWVVALGYEVAQEIEPRLQLPQCALQIPQALALRAPVALIRDRSEGTTILISEPGYESLSAQVQLDAQTVWPRITREHAASQILESDPSRYAESVAKIIDYIAAGDVFQVNLSRAWHGRWPQNISPAFLYAALRESNPAPFAGLLQWGNFTVASSSPERLISVRDGMAQTRPIAGTRPRCKDDDDSLRSRELIAHPKERAEHIMLVDLERNDLGRVCEPGSVFVNEMMSIESYPHVHHIVSNIHGKLRANVTPVDVIRAVFPGGTITGCPKLRCMEIIAELEGEGRGFYTGAMGYIGVDGAMDLNILIRSITLQDGVIEFRAGGGIVADSICARELEETRAKARGLLRALQPNESTTRNTQA